ncbi:PEP-CTERM sorting domain-containing protein [Aeoliella straminimaris]|uniref:PEP-CTERM sorting domain-containing protein n=1 Tax=Aeoliella straminimaris TaxID=2954799 RepID=UPI003CC50570
MTPDGSIIVGYSAGESGPSSAFVWTEERGMEDFLDVLKTRHGLAAQLEDWQLGWLGGVSRNGQFFAGIGAGPDGLVQPFLVRLDAPWGTTAVPEPSTVLLALLAISSLAVFRRVI